MVNVNCTGGGGYFSDDVSATKAQVVSGKNTVTRDSNDDVVEGTMADVGAADAQKSNAVASNNLYLRMTNGAHRTSSQASGYPEVYIPLQTLRTTIGATDAQKILAGTTIAGLAGTMVNRGAWSGTLALSGSITIPQGWHNGSGKISRSYSTYSGGTFTPSASDQTIPTSGKILTGNVNCKADANLIAGNIKHGVSIFGVTGQLNGVTHTAYNGSVFSGALKNGVQTNVKDINGVKYEYIVQDYGTIYYSSLTNDSVKTITSGSLTTTAHEVGSVGWSASAGFMSRNPIDLTAFKTIKITFRRNADSGMNGTWGMNFADVNNASIRLYKDGARTQIDPNESSRRISVGESVTNTFDISGYSGSYYVVFYNSDWNGETNDNHEYYWNITYTNIEFIT